jgi:NAD(P)-dependent dehydrogenase (short-subunit alcohol dehydrogenase family)
MEKKSLESLFRLDGKVIIITGAAGLLGRKHAEAIAAFGGTPVLLDLYEEPVKQLADELNEKYSVSAIGMSLNITNENAIFINCNQIVKQFGKIDGLVNNAANNPKVEDNREKNFSRLENFPLESWNQDVAVGLTGAFLCAKYYGYKISQNPEGGSIVNISSDLGLISPDQRLYAKEGLLEEEQPVKPVTYSVIKTGIIGLTRYLATYWSDKNVRCNAICPGGVENGQPDEFLLKVSSRIPLNRLAKSDEYQGTLIWMLSEASSYLNGAVISVDGGRTAW